jgi:hypothetical protein
LQVLRGGKIAVTTEPRNSLYVVPLFLPTVVALTAIVAKALGFEDYLVRQIGSVPITQIWNGWPYWMAFLGWTILTFGCSVRLAWLTLADSEVSVGQRAFRLGWWTVAFLILHFSMIVAMVAIAAPFVIVTLSPTPQ